MSNSKLLGPEVGYIDLLDAATIENSAKEFKGKSPLRPSAAGYCPRELYHGLQEFHGLAKYPKEARAPNVSRLLNLGHSIEWHVIKEFQALRDIFELKYKQQSLSFAKLVATQHPEWTQWLEGSLDLVLWSSKYKCVADVKSKKDAQYGRESTWDKTSKQLSSMRSVEKITAQAFWVNDLIPFLDELNDPFFAANFKQLNLYAGSEFLRERGVDHAAIIQYNKNTSMQREVRFRPCRVQYDKTIKMFQDVLTAVDTNNPDLAPKEHRLGSFKCKFCPYKKECWK